MEGSAGPTHKMAGSFHRRDRAARNGVGHDKDRVNPSNPTLIKWGAAILPRRSARPPSRGVRRHARTVTSCRGWSAVKPGTRPMVGWLRRWERDGSRFGSYRACLPRRMARAGLAVGSGGFAFRRIVIVETGVAVVAVLRLGAVILAAFTILSSHSGRSSQNRRAAVQWKLPVPPASAERTHSARRTYRP